MSRRREPSWVIDSSSSRKAAALASRVDSPRKSESGWRKNTGRTERKSGEVAYSAVTMAAYQDRYPQNSPGVFYVDDQCIDCDMCRLNAPEFFTRNDERAHSFVHRQPATEADVEVCLEAVDGCPVEAIGSDGPENGKELRN